MINEKQTTAIIDIADNLGWKVKFYGKHINFYKLSQKGLPFTVDVNQNDFKTLKDLSVELNTQHQDFDVSAETYLWLDSEGHGKAGACHDMRDLYNDMEECENELRKLSEAMGY